MNSRPLPQHSPHDPLLLGVIKYLAEKESQPPSPPPSDAPAAMTLRAFFDSHYAPRFLRNRMETKKLCKTALNHLRAWLGHDPTLTEVTPLFLSRFIDWLASRPGRSMETALKNYRHVKPICGFAAQLELMPLLPRMRIVGDETEEEDEDIPAFTMPEIEAMLGAAAALTGDVGGVPAADWWLSLILTLFNTALRIHAALCLRWQDYDERCFQVRKGTQKNRKQQTPGVTRQTAAYIERVRAAGRNAPEMPIWPWSLDPNGNYRALDRHFRKRILLPAGVADVKGKLFHRFREASATELRICELTGVLPKGAATEQLGHSDERTTNVHYVDAKRLPRNPMRHCDSLPELKIAGSQLKLFTD